MPTPPDPSCPFGQVLDEDFSCCRKTGGTGFTSSGNLTLLNWNAAERRFDNLSYLPGTLLSETGPGSWQVINAESLNPAVDNSCIALYGTWTIYDGLKNGCYQTVSPFAFVGCPAQIPVERGSYLGADGEPVTLPYTQCFETYRWSCGEPGFYVEDFPPNGELEPNPDSSESCVGVCRNPECPPGWIWDEIALACAPNSVSPFTAGSPYPWVFHDLWGRLHLAHAEADGIHYQRSDHPSPPFTYSAMATSTAGDIQPRMVQERSLGRLLLIFSRVDDIYEAASDDDGETWTTPTLMFTGGAHPTIAVDPVTGAILRAAWRSATIVGRVQYPGDSTSGVEFTFKNSVGSNLTVANDTFHISPADDGPGRWILVAQVSGIVKTYQSFDDARTWAEVS